MLFDLIAKLGVQILKPEAAASFSFPPQWTPPVFVNPPVARGVGGADLFGPVPDFIEV